MSLTRPERYLLLSDRWICLGFMFLIVDLIAAPSSDHQTANRLMLCLQARPHLFFLPCYYVSFVCVCTSVTVSISMIVLHNNPTIQERIRKFVGLALDEGSLRTETQNACLSLSVFQTGPLTFLKAHLAGI